MDYNREASNGVKSVMTITIDLPPDVEETVKTQAAKEGLPLED